LNIYKIPTQTDVSGSTIENIYIDTVRSVRAATKIPLAVKLSPYFSSFANMAASLNATLRQRPRDWFYRARPS